MSDELEGGDFTVVEGRDGHLFLGRYERTDILGLYTDPDALPASVFETWSRVLAARREYFGRRGIPYVTLVVPDACLVYADKLPSGVTLTPESPYRRIEALLDEATRQQCLYVLDDLVTGRAEQDTFKSTDSHWTDFGAYLAYRRTMAALAVAQPNIEVLPPERIAWSDRRSFGALGVMADHERQERVREAQVLESRCRTTWEVSTEVRDGYRVVEQDRPDLPTAVVFRDSFMTNAHKFFSESFRRTVYVSHPNHLFFDLIEAEDPDVVIYETVERRLSAPPDEPSLEDFRMTFGDLLLDDPDAIRAQVISRSLLRAGDVTGALAASDVAMARVRPTARLMLHRSRLMSRLGKPGVALDLMRTAFTLDPLDAPVAYLLAQGLRQHDRLPEAAAAARWAVRLEPRHAEFWSFAVLAAVESRDFDSAHTLAQDAVEHRVDDSVLHYLDSQALVGLDDLRAAEDAVRKALIGQPDNGDYLRQLASVQIRTLQWPAARASLASVRSLEPDAHDLDAFENLVEEKLAAAEA